MAFTRRLSPTVQEQSGATSDINRAARSAAEGAEHLQKSVEDVCSKAVMGQSIAQGAGTRAEALRTILREPQHDAA